MTMTGMIRWTLLAASLATTPLSAQPAGRQDCVSEEITGVAFFDVCGSDRDTLQTFRDRIATAKRRSSRLDLIERLREIACDAQRLDGDLRDLVDNSIALAGTGDHEDEIVALAESGMPNLFRGVYLWPDTRFSAAASERLGRVMADRNADLMLRTMLIRGLQRAGLEQQRIQRIAYDRSDPAQFAAAMAVTENLDDDRRAALLDEPNNALYAGACTSATNRTPKVLHALCHVAGENSLPVDARTIAIVNTADHVRDCDECFARLRELLLPENLFTVFDETSAQVILEAMPWEEARQLALTYDSSPVAGLTQRQHLDDFLFILRSTPDPNYLPYDLDP